MLISTFTSKKVLSNDILQYSITWKMYDTDCQYVRFATTKNNSLVDHRSKYR